MKIDLALNEVEAIFRAINVIDPHNIFLGQLRQKLAEAAKADKEKKDK